MTIKLLVSVSQKGGSGSGNYGHTGRPGIRGGSGGSGGSGGGGIPRLGIGIDAVLDKVILKHNAALVKYDDGRAVTVYGGGGTVLDSLNEWFDNNSVHRSRVNAIKSIKVVNRRTDKVEWLS